MNLTEEDALAIVYDINPKAKRYDHTFETSKDENFEYVLTIFDTINGKVEKCEYFFGSKKSVVSDGTVKVDITTIVNAYLAQNKTL